MGKNFCTGKDAWQNAGGYRFANRRYGIVSRQSIVTRNVSDMAGFGVEIVNPFDE